MSIGRACWKCRNIDRNGGAVGGKEDVSGWAGVRSIGSTEGGTTEVDTVSGAEVEVEVAPLVKRGELLVGGNIVNFSVRTEVGVKVGFAVRQGIGTDPVRTGVVDSSRLTDPEA